MTVPVHRNDTHLGVSMFLHSRMPSRVEFPCVAWSGGATHRILQHKNQLTRHHHYLHSFILTILYTHTLTHAQDTIPSVHASCRCASHPTNTPISPYRASPYGNSDNETPVYGALQFQSCNKKGIKIPSHFFPSFNIWHRNIRSCARATRSVSRSLNSR